MRAELFDELDIIRGKLEEGRSDWDPSQKPDKATVQRVVDSVLYALVMAYVFGKNSACSDLGWKTEVNQDKMSAAIYRKVDGKDFVDRVVEYMDTYDVEAIMRVAETDGIRVYNTGGMDTAETVEKDTGREVMKTWDTMKDNRVRETHDYLEGSTVPLDRAFFTFDGDSAMAPGGFTLPSNNVGCRCGLIYSYADAD